MATKKPVCRDGHEIKRGDKVAFIKKRGLESVIDFGKVTRVSADEVRVDKIMAFDIKDGVVDGLINETARLNEEAKMIVVGDINGDELAVGDRVLFPDTEDGDGTRLILSGGVVKYIGTTLSTRVVELKGDNGLTEQFNISPAGVANVIKVTPKAPVYKEYDND